MIVLKGLLCCQPFLLHFVSCERTHKHPHPLHLCGTFCTRRGNGQSQSLSHSSQKPLTSPPDTACASFSQWLAHCGPALITLTPFFPPSLEYVSSHIFGLRAWRVLCVSQMKHLTFLLGGFHFSQCNRKLSGKCASGAAVCSTKRVPLGRRAQTVLG